MQPNHAPFSGQGQGPPPTTWGPPPAGFPDDKQQFGGQVAPYTAAAYPPPQQPPYGYQQQPGAYPPQQYAAAQQPPPAAAYGGAYQQQPGAYQQPAPAAVVGSGAPPQRANSGMNLSGSYVVNVDPDMETSMKFADTVVRNGFVRKVFGIVALQLLITVGFTCITMFVPGVKTYVRRNNWMFWLAWILALVLILVLACVEKARRVFPMNMILLFAFTGAQSFLVGTLTAHYNEQAVLLAFAVTAVAVVVITLFAINTKIDVTRWGTLLLVALVVFVVLLLFGLFLRSKVLHLVIAGIACLLFSAYLLYDIQLVMGGRYYSISPDEYVFAALNIYLDIINLFMWILTIIGLAGGNNN